MDNAEDKFFQESHYNIIRIFLSISGLWSFHSADKRCAIYIGILLLLGSGMIFKVLGTIEVWPDTFEVVDSIPLLFFNLLAVIKVICLIYTLPKIKILLIKVKDYWYSPKSDEEAKILDSYAVDGRKFGYAYTVFLLGDSALFISSTLLNKIFHTKMESNEESYASNKAQIGVLYRVNYMVDINTYYVPIFIHMAVCEFSHVVLLVTVDVLYLTLVQHCCGLFAALRYSLETAFDNMDGLMQTFVRNASYSNMAYSIRRHAEVIQFINMLESIYRLPLFLHVGYSISILSIVGFQVITNTENMNIARHNVHLSGIILNAFFENWQGQKVIDCSEKVYESAYNAQWHNMPIATKKLLIMVIMRSFKLSTITAGKFIVMSYVNFNAVMRISSSFFMLLRFMQ